MGRRLTLILAVVLVLLDASPGTAGVLDAAWTSPTTNSDGSPLTDLSFYRVYYSSGSAPCPGASFFSVPAASSSPAPNSVVTFRLTGLKGGTPQFVSVTAVDTSGNESACSSVGNAPARTTFSVSPSGPINFGSVSLGSFADQTLTLQNTVGGTISGTVSVPAPFSVVSGSSFNLSGQNASQTVTVRFRPTATATATANLTITADGDTTSRTLTGNGGAATTLTGLTANVAPPRAPGSTITFTANATGGSTPYQFKWWVFDGGSWTVARDWSTANTFAWTPSTANPNYSVGVWVRSAGETADQPSGYPASSAAYTSIPFPIQVPVLTLTGLTADRTAPQAPGSTTTFTASATGGTSYQFKWWVFDGTTWNVLRDWSTGNTFAWTPSTANPNSRVGVWVRGAGETADQPNGYPANSGAYRDMPFPIQVPVLTLTNLTANLAAPQSPGSSVTFTATATGGIAPYQFKWWVWNGAAWIAVSNWGTSNTFTWTPGTPNPGYSFGVWVRSAGETADLPSGYPANSGAYTSIPFAIQ